MLQEKPAERVEIAVSVVIPVYKVEKYIAECVESVLAQNFDAFEIILVDDGSPDRSGEICEKFAKQDRRVRVFHQENKGVSAARKLGVEHARGEWICFVDSDDKLAPNALETLFSFADAGTDLIEGSLLRFSRDEKTGLEKFHSESRSNILERIRSAKKIETSGLEYGKFMVQASPLFTRGPYSKIIRRKLFSEARALDVPREIIYGEDAIANMRLSTRIRRAVRVPADVYFYRENPDGICANTAAHYDRLDYWLLWWSEAKKCFDDAPAEFGEIWKIFVRSTFASAWTCARDFSVKKPETQEWLALLDGHWEELRPIAKIALLASKFPLSLIPENFLKICVKILFPVKITLARALSFLRKHLRKSVA